MLEMDKQKFQELLARARAISEAAKLSAEVAAADNLAAQVNNTPNLTIDLTKAGIDAKSIGTDVGQDAAVEVIRDVISNISREAISNDTKRTIGVARTVILNSKQTAFNDLVQSGKSCVLIGAAGTGKTTSMRQVTQNLVTSERIKLLSTGTKYLQVGKPGVAILSYTRKAVNNIRHAVADEFKSHTLTIHKLLEFAPIFYEIEDPNNKGDFKNTMRFEPKKCKTDPLPAELKFIAIEEASMVSVELYELLQDAMPHTHQEVFLGDIQQLPPIFGLAILGFKMLSLPVIELTEVYRQALNSPIISLAWKILGGNPHDFSGRKETFSQFSKILNRDTSRIRCPILDQYSRESDEGEVFIQVWQKRLADDTALLTFIKQATTWADQGYYNPKDDIILCPFNKGFGTIEINKGIMQHLGRKRGAVVYEIIAGFNKHYLAVGDRVLYDKEDAIITRITRNGEYLGQRPQSPSESLDRWGAMQQEMSEAERLQVQVEDSEMDMEAIEKFLETASVSSEDRVQAASHVVHIKYAYQDEDDAEIELSKASEINNLLGGYALTVHKFQGSEAEKVFLVFHDTHIKMISRELLYTAVTRARKFLHIICETNTFEKGIKSQRIKGNTLAEKAKFFQGEASKRDLEKHVLEKLDQPVGEMIGGQVAIKLEDIVPMFVRFRIKQNLEKTWKKAEELYGKDKVGSIPELSFQLRRKMTLGLAYYTKGLIKINPVWAAVEDSEIKDHIRDETIVHEAAHILNWRLNKGKGHGQDWKSIMLDLGIKPERLYTGELPPWMSAKKELLTATFAKLKLEQTDEAITDDGEE